MRWNSNFSTCELISSTSRRISSAKLASSSAFAISKSSLASSKRWRVADSPSTTTSNCDRSRPNSCAFSWFFQMSGFSNSRRTSTKRRSFSSKSKIPPKRFAADCQVLNFFFNRIDFDWHGRSVSLCGKCLQKSLAYAHGSRTLLLKKIVPDGSRTRVLTVKG